MDNVRLNKSTEELLFNVKLKQLKALVEFFEGAINEKTTKEQYGALMSLLDKNYSDWELK